MSLRHALLGLLEQESDSGYDLLKKFEGSLGNVWSATQSQVYTELTRLAEGGLLDVAAEGPRGRKEYSITPAGREELRHWLVETEPERTRRSDMLLRVFFLGAITPEQAHAFLVRQAAQARGVGEALEELDRTAPWGDDDLSVYGRMALEFGKRHAAMEREWAEWAATQLAEPRRG